MNPKLFVYGTLMIPEIQYALLKKELRSQDAYLEGFSANSIVFGQYTTEYPFLMPSKNKNIKGKILFPLDAQDLNIIKFYEGSEYTLMNVSVTVKGSETETETPTFMLSNRKKVEYGPEWDYNNFIKNHLETYLSEIIPELLMNYNM